MERFDSAQRPENGETENGRMEIIILAPDGNVRLMMESGGKGAQTTQNQTVSTVSRRLSRTNKIKQ
jgi:hypothetical protein